MPGRVVPIGGGGRIRVWGAPDMPELVVVSVHVGGVSVMADLTSEQAWLLAEALREVVQSGCAA